MTVTRRAATGETMMPALLERARALFAERGVEAYIVGGYVRDRVIGRQTGDADVAVLSADVEGIGRELADAIAGSFYVLDEGRRYARVLTPPDDTGARARLDLTPIEGNIEQDLSRRDFTVNAMALPLGAAEADQAVLDPFGGRQDCERAILRAVHDDIFVEDAARLLRAIRLRGQLAFPIEDATEALARRDAARIGDVSPERVQEEFCRILALPDSRAALRHLDELGLLHYVLPELNETRGVEQPAEHYWNVFDHLVETVGFMDRILGGESRESAPVVSELPWTDEVNDYFSEEVSGGVTRSVLTKIACLLHDVAKPRTKTTEEGGRTRFLGHPTEGAEMAGSLMERLRFSRRGIAYVSMLVTQHLRPMQLSNNMQTPTRRALYRYRRDVGDAAIGTLYLSMADYLAAKGPMLEPQEWRHRARHCSLVLESILAPPEMIEAASAPAADGRILMEALGIGPGPELGRILDAVRESIGAGEVSTTAEAIAMARCLRETHVEPLTEASREE